MRSLTGTVGSVALLGAGILALAALGACGSEEASPSNPGGRGGSGGSGGKGGVAGSGGSTGGTGGSTPLDAGGTVDGPYGGLTVLVGQSREDDFPATANAYQATRRAGATDIDGYDGTVTLLSQAADGSHEVVFATYFGGTKLDRTLVAAIDADDNVYVAGRTESADLPMLNAIDPQPGGRRDCFVAKFDKTGALLFSTYLAGADNEEPYAMAVDATGVYVAGRTASADFPATPGSAQPSYGGAHEGFSTDEGGGDGFVTKLALDGSTILWSTFLGGGFSDAVTALSVDASGSVYVAGSTESTDFPTTPGVYQAALSGMPSSDDGLFFNLDAFVAKLPADGSRLEMSTMLGGGKIDRGSAVFVGGDGDVYLGGSFDSNDFPEASGFTVSSGYAAAGFLARFSPTGSEMKSLFQVGTTGESGVTAIFQGGPDLYIAGTTDQGAFATPGAHQNAVRGERDAFLAKMAPDATAAAAFTYLGGTTFDALLATGVDDTGRVHVVLTTASSDLPLGGDGVVHAGDRDFYWAALQPNASALVFGTYFGGPGDDVPWGAAFAFGVPSDD
jgi:hypothetical protein